MNPTTRRIGRWVTAAGILLIASQTLVPHPELQEQVGRTPLWCIVCGDLGALDFFLNIVLFIPYGFGLRLQGRSRLGSQVLICATTFTIELLQFKLIAGRDASLGDLLTNSLGGALGIRLAETWPHLLLPTWRAARRLLVVAGALWVMVWGGSGFLLGLSLPKTLWFSQLGPEGVYLDSFHGTVVAASVNAARMQTGPLAASPLLRDSILAHGARVEVAAVLGRATRYLGSILSIFDEHQTEILVLGQDGRDLLFRIRTRVADVALRGPAVRLPAFLPEQGGDTVSAVGSLHQGHLTLVARLGTRQAETSLTLSPSWGWEFLLPLDYAFGPEARLLTALWIAGLLLPIGYWSARGWPSATWPAFSCLPPLGVAAFGLGAVPWLTHLPPTHWSEWVAAASGSAVGWGLGRRSLRFKLPQT